MDMAKRTYPVIIAILMLSAGCVPQAELVKLRTEVNDLRSDVKEVKGRVPDLSGIEKRQDRLETDLKGTTDLQSAFADQNAKNDQLATDIQIMQGKLEENNFRLKELAQKLDDKVYKLAELSARVEQLENKLKSQPSGTAVQEAKPAKTLEPTEAYNQAKSDYDKGNFDLAIAGFENYLKQFPDASQADSAQYWIGECYYSGRNMARPSKDSRRSSSSIRRARRRRERGSR